jgi:hypothetical protein
MQQAKLNIGAWRGAPGAGFGPNIRFNIICCCCFICCSTISFGGRVETMM